MMAFSPRLTAGLIFGGLLLCAACLSAAGPVKKSEVVDSGRDAVEKVLLRESGSQIDRPCRTCKRHSERTRFQFAALANWVRSRLHRLAVL